MLNFIRAFLGRSKPQQPPKTQQQIQQPPKKNKEVWEECGLTKSEFNEAFKKSPRGWYQ